MIKTGTFRLNSEYLLGEAKKNGINSIYRISQNADITAHTAYKLFKSPKLYSIEMAILYRLLTDGIGLTHEEMMNLRLRDWLVPVEAEDE